MPEHAVATATSVRVRRLTKGDLSGVVRIDAIHTGAAQPVYWKRLIGQALARGSMLGFAAEVDGELGGFLFGDVRAFEFGSEPCGWILEVGVDPRFTRRGIASALLAEACRRLRESGVTTIRTMVRRNDVPMLTFFRTNGFVGGPYVQLELLDPPGSDAPPSEPRRA